MPAPHRTRRRPRLGLRLDVEEVGFRVTGRPEELSRHAKRPAGALRLRRPQASFAADVLAFQLLLVLLEVAAELLVSG